MKKEPIELSKIYFPEGKDDTVNNNVLFCIDGEVLHVYGSLDDALHKKDFYAGDVNQFVISNYNMLNEKYFDCMDKSYDPEFYVKLKYINDLPLNRLIQFKHLIKLKDKFQETFIDIGTNKSLDSVGKGFLDLIQDMGYSLDLKVFPTSYNEKLTYLFEATSYVELLIYIIFECSIRNILNIKICPTCLQAFKPSTRKSEIFCSTSCRKKWNNIKRDSNPARRKYESRRRMIRNEAGTDEKLYNLYIKWTEKTKDAYDKLYEKYKYMEDDLKLLDLVIYSMTYADDNLHNDHIKYMGNAKEYEQVTKEIDEFGEYLKDVWQQLKEDVNNGRK